MVVDSLGESRFTRRKRSSRLLATLEPYRRVAIVSHVNPDPDALASMMGLRALLGVAQPGKPVLLTVDGMIARAENQVMVEALAIDLTPVESVEVDKETAVVMVDSQPHTGRRHSEINVPTVVIDHHETPGRLEGVAFRDIRPNVGATSTVVTGYLLEREIPVSPRLATGLLYGIESEISGYPREASSMDDGAMVWLYPRADKDLLSRIRDPKLPLGQFASFQSALANSFVYGDVVVSWCGTVGQPDIVAEVADFLVRYDQVNWALAAGVFEGVLKLSLRVTLLGEQAGEVLRAVVDGLGNAGGHDRRAGGSVPLPDASAPAVSKLLSNLRGRLLKHLKVREKQGRRLLEPCPTIPAP